MTECPKCHCQDESMRFPYRTENNEKVKDVQVCAKCGCYFGTGTRTEIFKVIKSEWETTTSADYMLRPFDFRLVKPNGQLVKHITGRFNIKTRRILRDGFESSGS